MSLVGGVAAVVFVYNNNVEISLVVAVLILKWSELEFFYNAIDATLKFEKKENQIYKLTLFQNWMDLDFLKKWLVLLKEINFRK